ncbi:hypothetical protein PLESTB_000875300 [Pleodorina starrii]|uniref:Uncharacterized protein n=1 Tax=Pleodorina starrii TaxID=330485 RepID=A0A9W6BLY2_9CHLO|nr:hypothetical protein PLESTB_000875300 [Pleodorina starrii]
MSLEDADMVDDGPPTAAEVGRLSFVKQMEVAALHSNFNAKQVLPAEAGTKEFEFEACHLEWACALGLDVASTAGQSVKARMSNWPDKCKPNLCSKESFYRAFQVAQILTDEGFYADELTDPKRETYLRLNPEVIDALKAGGLKALEVTTVVEGIGSLAPSEAVPAAKKKKGELHSRGFNVLNPVVVPKSGQQRLRSKDWVVGLVWDAFGADIDNAPTFRDLDMHPDKITRFTSIKSQMGGKAADQLGLPVDATQQHIFEAMNKVLYNKWRNRQNRADAGEGNKENRGRVPGAAVPKKISWTQLLDSDPSELDTYNSSSSHAAYLQGKAVDDPIVGSFLVGAKAGAKGKPLPLAVGLLLGPLDAEAEPGSKVKVLVVSTTATKNWPGVIHLPVPVPDFDGTMKCPVMFTEVEWPVVGLLAVMDGRNAIDFAKLKWGLQEASLINARRAVKGALDMAGGQPAE